MGRLKIYLFSTRWQFFPAIILPVGVGASYAFHKTQTFDVFTFSLTLLAAILYHAGMNVMNDYFDHLYGADNANKTPLSPFTGGSRMIQKNLMTPEETLWLSLILLMVGSLVGLYIAYLKGVFILLIGMLGLFSGLSYSARPLFFASRGLGELFVGLNFGVLAVSGAYFVQTGTLEKEVVFISLPLSFLVAGLLYINEFPDYEADRDSGKKNLVVRLGTKRGCWGIFFIVFFAYLGLIVSLLKGYLPPLSIIAFLSLPFSLRASFALIKNHDKPPLLLPAIKAIITAHLLTGVLLIVANLS